MSPLIASRKNPQGGRIWIFGLCGTLASAWLGSGCGENTEKVLSKVPTVIYVNATGGASGGADSGGNSPIQSGGNASGGTSNTPGAGGSTAGGAPLGGASAAGGATGGTSGLSTGPLMSAVGTPIGFAAVGGNGPTTGGGKLPADKVTDCSTLQSLLEDDSARVIVVDGVLNPTGIDCTRTPTQIKTCELSCDANTGDTTGRVVHRFLDATVSDCSSVTGGTATTPIDYTTWSRNEKIIYLGSNKTLLGVGPNPTIIGATLYLNSTTSNVIIQNLNLTGVNPKVVEAGDAITIDGANHVWVDHCGFSLISDGFIDTPSSSSTVSATNITISWNHFDGRNPSACSQQHNFANTIENSTVTFHHNYYDHTLSCSPKVSKASARVHLFNNFWQNVLYYSIQIANGAQATLQSNYFKDSNRPYYGNSSCLQSPATCGISVPAATPNLFEGVSATENQDTGGIAITPLPYTLSAAQLETDASVIPAEVSNPTTGAGPTLSP